MLWPEAQCPACNSKDGVLGTSYAYFICRKCGTERYWTKDHQHPNDWNIAIEASPFARARREFERSGIFGFNGF